MKNHILRHEACGFGYKVVCHYDKQYSKPTVIFRAGKFEGQSPLDDVISKCIEKNV